MSAPKLPAAYRNLPVSAAYKEKLSREFVGFTQLFPMAWQLVLKTLLTITLPYLLSIAVLIIGSILGGVFVFDTVANSFTEPLAWFVVSVYIFLALLLNTALLFLTRVTYLRRLSGQRVPLWSVRSSVNWSRAGKLFLVMCGVSLVVQIASMLVSLPFWLISLSEYGLGFNLFGELLGLVLALIVLGLIGSYPVLLAVEGSSLEKIIPLAYGVVRPYFWVNTLRWFWFNLVSTLILVISFLIPAITLSAWILSNALPSSSNLSTIVSGFLVPLMLYSVGCLLYGIVFDAYHLLATANLRALDCKSRSRDLTK